MEKINIAELLQDCPKGMELYSPLFGDCKFVKVHDYEAEIIVELETGATVSFLTDGRYYDYPNAECILFPKGKTTWEGFTPPCQFKDGDVIYTDDFIAIFSNIAESGAVWYHCYYCTCTRKFKAKHDSGIGNINSEEFRLATEEEKQKLFDAIKKHGYKWNTETKTLEKLPKFKVGDKVVNHKYGTGDITQMLWIDNEIVYEIHFEDCMAYCKANELCKFDALKDLLSQGLTEYLSHATREELDKTMEEIEIALAPFKVGDKVIVKCFEKMGEDEIICVFKTYDGDIKYKTKNHLDTHYFMGDSLMKVEKSNKEENMEKRLEPVYELGTGKILYYVDNNSTTQDKGNISDGYHTFNELYEYRLLYNASMFNELAKQSLYDVHKSKLHSDGTIPFGDENWFIVQAELPTGQISNHYEMKDWDLFQVPIKEKANPYDGHTPQDVAKRLREFLTPKSQYPKDYKECCKVLAYEGGATVIGYDAVLLNNFQKLKLCRDAYWKIGGKQMGLDKPWEPDWNNDDETKFCIYTTQNMISLDIFGVDNRILAFPTEEMRDAFFENFKDLINNAKELL